MKSWQVPMRTTSDGWVIVGAEDEQQAREVAEAGGWEGRTDEDLIDWEVTGKPKEIL